MVKYTLAGCAWLIAMLSFATETPLKTTDFVYEPQIRTVLFYPTGSDPVAAVLQPPVVSLQQATPLILEFDELGDKINYYRAKVIFCNVDWSISNLSDMDITPRFNEFTFEQPQLSGNNARVLYTHQRLEVPQVKLPGNYLLVVYHENNPKDLVVTRRFVVYNTQAVITPRITFSTGITERTTNQQVEFTIDYGTLNVGNPWTDLKVVIRQNYQWYTTITNLKPTSVREDQHIAEYRQFNLENNFPGVNEFRFFDIRSIRTLGQNVAKINSSQDTTQVYLAVGESRSREGYSQVVDQNGRFVIDQYEFSNGSTEADYVRVFFTLKADPVKEPVYIWGALTDWQTSNTNRMTYSAEDQVYRGSLLLKQGYYNFRYVVAKPGNKLDEAWFEGNHFETENVYEIIVYNRPPGARADMIIGYIMVDHNKRR
ncbi:type IX secretion system plug protein domain-containing protein [Xanthocytophaga agilis]|uniref:DUF5103 domain-containing protein n=1 Tax=Xanthocytophaga agilis TaxID=3048010 RepID=A0AAE3R7K1_9BACT|nr:type IX secretion system plug protein domain-containing protein [Xanthocytophaga agilis]MDJ1502885.1 DUF5103 domain-containing protein [Xanthocytophaga agilis]